jgi:hypothetical protein
MSSGAANRFAGPTSQVNQPYPEALKVYFTVAASLVEIQDIEIGDAADPEVDFIIRTSPDRMALISERMTDLAYDLRTRYGVRLTTIVVPKSGVTEEARD